MTFITECTLNLYLKKICTLFKTMFSSFPITSDNQRLILYVQNDKMQMCSPEKPQYRKPFQIHCCNKLTSIYQFNSFGLYE